MAPLERPVELKPVAIGIEDVKFPSAPRGIAGMGPRATDERNFRKSASESKLVKEIVDLIDHESVRGAVVRMLPLG